MTTSRLLEKLTMKRLILGTEKIQIMIRKTNTTKIFKINNLI